MRDDHHMRHMRPHHFHHHLRHFRHVALAVAAAVPVAGVAVGATVAAHSSDETFTTANATSLLAWAKSKGIGEISVWSLNRDNGNCPGSKGEDACSGIDQTEWQFSHTFESFS
jgi:hypothetical protein